MKKLLFLAGAVLLMAAACNSQQASENTPPPAATNQANPPAPSPVPQAVKQNAAQLQVDATANDLNENIDSEDSINSQSDDDITNSDQSVVKDSDGVSNANY